MDNDLCRSVEFHAPPQNLDTSSISSLTTTNWDPPPISEAVEAYQSQAFLLSQNYWLEQNIFDSALTSLVSSSATTETKSGENNTMIRELIGKLSTELLPSSSSSPELNFPEMMIPISSAAPEIATDAGFAERSASFSRGFGNRTTSISFPRVESTTVDSRYESKSGSQRFSRKRKCMTKGKMKESSIGALVTSNPKKDGEADTKYPNPKKPKSEEEEKQSKSNNVKPPEPLKDYIHVRARRGQATDSHSLAERVRREKISERMKLLQDLVPGCNKVTGKALMLDEIINYVQSLQRQVEFLSMKLASVNTMDSLMSKSSQIIEANNSRPSQAYHYDSSAAQFLGHQFDHSTLLLPRPPHQYSQNAPQYPTMFRHDDLEAIVHMGFGHNQDSRGRDQDRTNP